MDIGYILTCHYSTDYTDNESELIQAAHIHTTLKPQQNVFYNMDIGYILTNDSTDYTDNESELIQAAHIHTTLKPQDIKLRTSPCT
jgi:hypothetical protein